MTYYYSPTPLEKWVSKLYWKLNISTPADLDVEVIARHFRIYIHRKEIDTFAYENGNFRSITLDQRLPFENQREQFYHELCHLLRHCGWQAGMMPEAFRELQEWEAKRFVPFAAIPFHMLRNFDLVNDPDVIQQLSEKFKITPQLCIQRLEHIKRNAKSNTPQRSDPQNDRSHIHPSFH
mgnify:CR=1 FL=1